jgi:3-phosphoshikimate 1-carboxyvinyltransferase
MKRSLREKFHNSSMELRIKRAPRIDIEITVPGDKSISHRAVIIAALSNGVCTLHGFLPSEDCMHTVNAMRALGVKIEQPKPDTLIVHGKKRVLTPPKKEIDCGNSGTTMRLLAGLLSGQTFESRLVGDAGLSRRPMDRVIWPLHQMGANILAEGPEQTPPLRIRGGSLRGIRYRLPIASAQVKSSLLLAGLFAKGKTTVEEPSITRNHTELMLNYFLVRTAKDGDGNISVFGDQVPESRDFSIPGDISSAAFWLVAAAAQPRGHLLVRGIGLNDTRTALLGVLLRMGAQVREAVEGVDQLEPRGIVEVTGVPLKGTVIQGKEVPQLIDELPILAVAGALANGTTIIRHAQELRVKESDRIAAIAHNLRTMGAQVAEIKDGLEIDGPAALHGARVASFGDHRIAMAFAIAGLFADGETIVQDADCIRESYPGFETALEEFTNSKRMQISTPVIGSLTPAPVEEA